MASTEKNDTPEEAPVRSRPGVWFRLLIPVTFVFVLSCFILLTHDLFADQGTSLARFFSQYGTRILAIEAALAVALAVIAMFSDRLKTLRNRTASTHEQPAQADQAHDNASTGN